MDEFDKMNYRVYLSEGAKGVLLGVHGFGSSGDSPMLKEIGSALRGKGYTTITFDLPSHGVNRNAVLTGLDECTKAFEAAVSYARTFDEPLSVFATSFGAYLTLLHIARSGDVFQNVILRAPAVYMDETFDRLLSERGYDKGAEVWKLGQNYPVYVDRQFREDLRENRLENCDFPPCAPIVIQGEKDAVVDPKKNEAFFRTKFGEKATFRYFPEADHSFGNEGERDAVLDVVLSVFE